MILKKAKHSLNRARKNSILAVTLITAMFCSCQHSSEPVQAPILYYAIDTEAAFQTITVVNNAPVSCLLKRTDLSDTVEAIQTVNGEWIDSTRDELGIMLYDSLWWSVRSDTGTLGTYANEHYWIHNQGDSTFVQGRVFEIIQQFTTTE